MESEALVLEVTDHGESDLIVTFFGRADGRFSAIAKGAKRSKKRFVNKLELFTFLHISYTKKTTNSLALLTEAEIYSSFLNLRRNVGLYTAASVIREFMLMGLKDGDVDEKVFQLCLWGLHGLDSGAPPPSVLALFLVRFFDHAGYRPELAQCYNCGTVVLQGRSFAFDSTTGSIICSHCCNRSSSLLELSHGSLKILSSAQNQPLERLHRLKFSGSILRESLDFLHFYGRYLYQRDISSWRLFEKCNNTGLSRL